MAAKIRGINSLHLNYTKFELPNNLASYNSIQKKDDKVRNKRKREGKVEIDWQRRSKFWLVRMCEKQKRCLISPD